ncbi:hypothetical protein G9A89_005344 [Geosiphon pyriformis]|nr:hypothetical protein G9A89_005344 [Geosiphon pyriformis]
MTTTRAKNKKAAPDIFPKISNKISTRRALSVVEATRQNVLEAFSLPSDREKLSLSKRHTWVSSSVVSIPTKSPKVFNNRPVNKLVFSSIAFTSGVASTFSSKKMVKKTRSSEKWKQLLASAIVTPRSTTGCVAKCVSGATFGGAWETISSHQRFAGWVVFTLVLGATFKIKLAYVSVCAWFFGCEFAFQISLDAVFLVELTSSVYFATLKIAKSLVVSEFGSSSIVVALYDVPLSISAADIKTAFSVFGVVAHVVLKSKLDSAVAVLNHWSVLVGKNSVKILPLVNQNETILFQDRFKAKLVNFSSGCTAFEISNMISQSSDSGHCFHFALVIFGFQADLDFAVVKTGTLRKCCIWWEIPGCQHCFWCQELGHLATDCKVFSPSSPKSPKVFALHFIGSTSYAKASAPLSSSEFPPLLFLIFSPIVVSNPLVLSWLSSLESDLTKLSALVESIVKPVGSIIKLFEQFINRNLVLSSNLGLKVNKVMIHMGVFSKVVGKLRKKVVFLKKKCCMEDVDMSGDLEFLLIVNNDVFSNLLSLWEHKSVDIKTNLFKTAEWLVGLALMLVVQVGLGTCSGVKSKRLASAHSRGASYKKPKKPVAVGSMINTSAGPFSLEDLGEAGAKPAVSWGSNVGNIASSMNGLSDAENMTNLVTEETSYAESGKDDNMDEATPKKTCTRMYALGNPMKQPLFDNVSDDNSALELPPCLLSDSNQFRVTCSRETKL